jgi:hypothetical protein
VRLEGFGQFKNITTDIKVNIQTCGTQPSLTRMNISEISLEQLHNNSVVCFYRSIALQMALSSNIVNDILTEETLNTAVVGYI